MAELPFEATFYPLQLFLTENTLIVLGINMFHMTIRTQLKKFQVK